MGEQKKGPIARCKEIDIVDFARQQGMSVVGKGNDFRLAEHDSFVFEQRKQKFHWNSRNIHGDIIDLAELFFVDETITGKKNRMKEATRIILDSDNYYKKVDSLHFESEEYKHVAEDYQPLTKKSLDYLTNDRKLSKDLIEEYQKKGLILEVKPKNERQRYLVRDNRLDNAVAFVTKDHDTGEVKGMTFQGIEFDKERFGDRGTYKHVDKNSNQELGFQYLIGKPKNLKFFESPIDMMSYHELNKDQLKDSWLVSMGGLKDSMVYSYVGQSLEMLGADDFIDSFEICVDNDAAGHVFFEGIERLQMNNRASGKIVQCKKGISNDMQVPLEHRQYYLDAAKEFQVDPEAIMAVHKATTNLGNTDQLATRYGGDRFFGKNRETSSGDTIRKVEIGEECCKVAEALTKCKQFGNGLPKYNFDKLYNQNYQGQEAIAVSDKSINLATKTETYFKSYENREYEWVKEVKKDWNDQLKHEKNMKAQRMAERQKFRNIFAGERSK